MSLVSCPLLRTMPRLRSVAKWAVLGVGVAQAATIAALSVVDYGRKRGRRHRPFPTAPPADTSVDDGTVTVYTKGRDLYDDMLATIGQAQRTIFFETYLWKGDGVGAEFKDALIEAAERGVDVYVAYDVVANLVVRPSFFRFSRRIQVLPHLPWTGMRGPIVWRSPGLNHRKMLIADSDVAYVGGYNIGSLYATRWRDTHARITGSGVLDLENTYVDYWNQSKKPHMPTLASPGGRSWLTPVKVTRNVPSMGVYPIRYSYLEAIDRAGVRIWMTHAYLIPDNDLSLALVAASERGVDVRIIVPAESNHIVADWLSRGCYKLLLSHGVRLFLYQGAMVHAKTATVDGQWSTIGTANLDRLSLVGNYEVNVEVIHPGLAAEMESLFLMDAANCVELTLAEWQCRPLAAKVSEAVLAPLRPLL